MFDMAGSCIINGTSSHYAFITSLTVKHDIKALYNIIGCISLHKDCGIKISPVAAVLAVIPGFLLAGRFGG